jgi:hypothetical protein
MQIKTVWVSVTLNIYSVHATYKKQAHPCNHCGNHNGYLHMVVQLYTGVLGCAKLQLLMQQSCLYFGLGLAIFNNTLF